MAAARAVAGVGPGRHRQHHVGRAQALRVDQVVRGPLGEHGRGERHPEVPVLDHPVDDADHPGIGRVGQDGAVAEGARAELHAPGAARHHAVGDEQLGDALLDPVARSDLVAALEATLADDGLHLGVGDLGPEIGGPERGGGRNLPAPPALLDVAEIGGAHRVGLVATRGEREEVLDPVLAGEEHVGLDVHEHAAAQGEAGPPVALSHQPGPAQERVLEQRAGPRPPPRRSGARGWRAAAPGGARRGHASGTWRVGPRPGRTRRAGPPRPGSPSARRHRGPAPSPCTRARRTSCRGQGSRRSRRSRGSRGRSGPPRGGRARARGRWRRSRRGRLPSCRW